MKKNIFILLALPFLIFTAAFYSCGEGDKKNAEADILSFTLKEKDVMEGNAGIKGTNINITVKKGTDLSQLTPILTLSEGATVNPPSGKVQDFTYPVKYTVVSEDGATHRVYTVTISYPLNTKLFSFETWKTVYNYEEPVETDASGNVITYWSSSNVGFRLFNPGASADKFPLIQGLGHIGKGATLITRKGVSMGPVNVPLVSGSMFSGVMDAALVATNPLGATKFGQPVTEEPYLVRGFYKYKSGSQMTDTHGNPVDGKDQGTIAVVFYEADDNLMLDGSNLYTHPSIIAKAIFHPTDTEGDSFQPFTLSLERINDATVDFTQHRYKMALVFASSAGGDKYTGAVGSCLMIDEVEILTR